MRTTLNLDEKLVAKARRLSGVQEKTRLLHLGLEALIQRETSARLAGLGGTMPELEVAPRRRARA